MRVADQHRSRAEQEVDILAAALIPDAAALALAQDDVAVHVAEGPARKDPLRLGHDGGGLEGRWRGHGNSCDRRSLRGAGRRLQYRVSPPTPTLPHAPR